MDQLILNGCFYHTFDVALSKRLIEADGLMVWWKMRFEEKLEQAK